MDEHPVLDEERQQNERQTLGDCLRHHLSKGEAREFCFLTRGLVGILLLYSLVERESCISVVHNEDDCHNDEWERRVELAYQPANPTANAHTGGLPKVYKVCHSRIVFVVVSLLLQK